MRTFSLAIIFISTSVPSHTTTDTGNNETTGLTAAQHIPVDLYDLGYYDGNWEKFCDRRNMYEEFLYYPEHEVKIIRSILCQKILVDRIYDNETIAACALYKYCLLMKPRVDQFIDEFVEKFSMNDTEKKQELVRGGDFDKTTTCYKISTTEFGEKCIASGNAFNSMFNRIFARACTYAGLRTEDILFTIGEVCRGKFMTDNIDWMPYFATIRFKF